MMATAVDGFQAEIERIMWPLWRNGNLVRRRLITIQDARVYQREVLGVQAQLRVLKEIVNHDKQQIEMSYQPVQTNARSNPLRRLLGAKKAVNQTGVMEPQQVSVQSQDAVAPYEFLSDYIDTCIQMFDRTKLAIDEAIVRGQIR